MKGGGEGLHFKANTAERDRLCRFALSGECKRSIIARFAPSFQTCTAVAVLCLPLCVS